MRKLLATAVAAALVSTAARAAASQSPVIAHTPVTTAASGGFVKVMAKVTDEAKVFPQVFFRYDSSASYEKALDMKPVKGEPHMYGANIPTRGAVVEYYVEAYDELGNGPGRVGSPEAPIHVTVGSGEPRANATTPPATPPSTTTPPPTPPGGASAPPSSSGASTWGSAPPSSSSARRTPVGRGQAESQSRTWTWAVGGTGLGLLAGGLIAGLAAKTAGNAYNDRLKDPQNNPVTLQSQYDAAKGMGSKATILTIAGAVLVAGGVALYFLEPGLNGTDKSGPVALTSEPGVSIAAAPVEGGGAVAVAGRF